MLQALLEHKLNVSFKDSHFEPSEDSQTSCVFGLLQYLPCETMWKVIRESCGCKDSINEKSGELLQIHFWPRWSADSNSAHVAHAL